MAKGVYVGISNAAKKVKKIYVGVGGVAKKVKKAYVGVGGVAKPFYSSDIILQSTPIDAPYTKCHDEGCSLNKNYGMFGFAKHEYNLSAYNSSLTLSKATIPSGQGRENFATTWFSNYSLFAGGYGDNGLSTQVDVFNYSLTRSSGTALSVGRTIICGAKNSSYGIISGCNTTKAVDAYNSSLTKTVPAEMMRAKYGLHGAYFYYALIAGGDLGSSTKYADIEAYNDSLTKTTSATLSEAKNVYGSGIGDYALFCGGSCSGSKASSVVEAFDRYLVRTIISPLHEARLSKVITFKDGNHLIVLPQSNNTTANALYDVYDKTLTRSVPNLTNQGQYKSNSATYVGDYILNWSYTYGSGATYYPIAISKTE